MDLIKKEELKDRIKKLRKEKGLTQFELAEMLHVTDKAVSKWETGDGNPEITILIELARVFGVSVDYLLIGKEAPKEIIIMSKIELCCKEDNVELFEELSAEALKGKDEQGKTIIDYIEKYDSKKVYCSLMSRFSPSKLISTARDSAFPNFKSDKIMELIFKFDDVNSLESIGFFKHNFTRWLGSITNNTTRGFEYKIYVDRYIELMIKNIPENSLILQRALTIHTSEKINNLLDWQSVYIKMLKCALLNNKLTEVEIITQTIININESIIREIQERTSNLNDYKKSVYRYSFNPNDYISSDYSTSSYYYHYAVLSFQFFEK